MQSHVAFNHALTEALEAFAFEASEESDDVSCDFEWCSLKIKQSRCKNESKINMNQATVILVNQNVGVVSVLNLKNVAHERVSCQRINQIIDSVLISRRLNITETNTVEVNKIH